MIDETQKNTLIICGIAAVGAILYWWQSSASNTPVVTGEPVTPTVNGVLPDYLTYNWPKKNDAILGGNLSPILPYNPNTNPDDITQTMPYSSTGNQSGGCCQDCGCNPHLNLTTGSLFPGMASMADYYDNVLKGFVDNVTTNLEHSVPNQIMDYFNNPDGQYMSNQFQQLFAPANAAPYWALAGQ